MEFLARRYMQRLINGDEQALKLLDDDEDNFKYYWNRGSFFEIEHYLTGPIFENPDTSVASSFFVSHAASLEHARLALLRPESEYPRYEQSEHIDSFINKLIEYGATVIGTNEIKRFDKKRKKVKVLRLPPHLDELATQDMYLIVKYNPLTSNEFHTTVVTFSHDDAPTDQQVQFHEDGSVAAIGNVKIGHNPGNDTFSEQSTTHTYTVCNTYLEWNERTVSTSAHKVLAPVVIEGLPSDDPPYHQVRSDVLEDVSGSLFVPYSDTPISSIFYTYNEDCQRLAIVMTKNGPKSVVTTNKVVDFLRDVHLEIDLSTNNATLHNPKFDDIVAKLQLTPEIIKLIQQYAHDYLEVESQGFNQGSFRFMILLKMNGGEPFGMLGTSIPYIRGEYEMSPKKRN